MEGPLQLGAVPPHRLGGSKAIPGVFSVYTKIIQQLRAAGWALQPHGDRVYEPPSLRQGLEDSPGKLGEAKVQTDRQAGRQTIGGNSGQPESQAQNTGLGVAADPIDTPGLQELWPLSAVKGSDLQHLDEAGGSGHGPTP